MECFSKKGGYDIHVSRYIEEEQGDKWLWFVSIVLLLKTCSYATQKLKNNAF